MQIKMKLNAPAVLTSAQPKDIIQTVLDIINSSKRKMPAHFTSNGNRTQSFCVDFDISETDEYTMASESWYQGKDPSIIKTGEDIMLAAYIAVKLGGEKLIPQLYQSIIETCSEELFKKHKDYFEHCADFGKLRAVSS
ncbi:MAG: hypothetical protein A2857_04925 [Candidatus Levybacteria bacterium RIFCSPHIGHO2_01_FULL_36_15]|nr:MAG: hypothetical protein A2857_04925 [Candidatus Levybacteria bacterium RIFCSPHIGHO2_01_FULL_36_15]OGH38565.1 MAG: hypothetical protein A2905_03965 [Candidatus Levybacteria bacterium RIFCSPLOWO2_01_FULL_36_10]